MHFSIRHRTQYTYSKPVRLGPHLLRFHPREGGSQRILEHAIVISPQPLGRNDHLDIEGNRVSQVWFHDQTDFLEIEVWMQVETYPHNVYNFILTPGAVTLPIDYPQQSGCVRAYLQRVDTNTATIVTDFAEDISRADAYDTVAFLDHLNRELHEGFERRIRDTGDPQSPAMTLQTRAGACRDLTVLFVDCCRAMGIPARYTSGYQQGDVRRDRRYLHAWPEVYLPGAGWRGFDPTHGEAVSDAHVIIAAAAHPRDTMPVSGDFSGIDVSSELDFTLTIEISDS